VDRADAFLAAHPKSQDNLRRIFTLKFATVREGEEPTRRRGLRSEFSDEEWRLVSELADHPNRLLVTATPEGGETYAEAAHEAIFRRWGKLRDWIAAEHEFLAWRTGLERDRQRWETAPAASKDDALLMGFGLGQAQSWLEKRADDLSQAAREFVLHSGEVDSERREAARQLEIGRIKADEELARLRAEKEAREQRERADIEARARQMEQRRAGRLRALVYIMLIGIAGLIGLIGWISRPYLNELRYWYTQVRPFVLSAEAERALKPGDRFRECAKDCPEMIVVPAGEFMMGSPATERRRTERTQRKITIDRSFAVSKFEMTFEQWDACVAVGGCAYQPSDVRRGRGTKPVINVSWNDAQRYLAWFSRMTGKRYRLLSEAEWEYAARAGKRTAYSWGDAIGKGNANCAECGSPWDDRETAPVGSFPANAFGLHDMHGNVEEWVQDCIHDDDRVATDGSERIAKGDCDAHVVRGGSYGDHPQYLRSTEQNGRPTDYRLIMLGFRVGRTLAP
jgi:formylglycine-generating enzyme required for sulfatase activity